MRRALAALLALAGALLLADAALTLAWQEPVSAVRAAAAQRGLERELRAAPPAAAAPAHALGRRRRLAALARAAARRRAPGDAAGRLRIPRLGLSAVVVQGVRPRDLRRGPGLYGAATPGERGTSAIAGHRTTYGAPFGDLDALRPGDAVVLEMPYATLGYEVRSTRIVAPRALEVLDRAHEDRLVLTACHPRFSARRRIAVTARLTSIRYPSAALKHRPDAPDAPHTGLAVHNR